ncbi:hypothetical protein [Marivirga sp.]|uniref:hypothetical protein n=1 Tax=Marivirga sp. TaxID=2018662 RepID=UPI002D7E3E23|nr:hypothetical protein [Marivirga sp.]HET8860756.1 hypothetical protein [Marivirga sp.]
MKKISFLFVFYLLIGLGNAWACDVCQANQPEPLKNITHGEGPQGDIDYVIIIIGIIIVGFTLFFSLKYLVKPGEKNSNHVKNIVVDEGSL